MRIELEMLKSNGKQEWVIELEMLGGVEGWVVTWENYQGLNRG